jgi:hypothetical protein
MALDLSKVKERDALRSQREPYWQRIRPGCFLGYRPSAREGAGTWIARAYDEDQRRYSLKALGDFGTLPGKDRFAEAKKEAEAFAVLVESGGQTAEKIETVEDACRKYAETQPDAAGRFRRNVYSDPIAKVKLAKLRRHHLKAWRQRLENKPALVTRRKKGPQITRPRASPAARRKMVHVSSPICSTVLSRLGRSCGQAFIRQWAIWPHGLLRSRQGRLAILRAINSAGAAAAQQAVRQCRVDQQRLYVGFRRPPYRKRTVN